MSFFDKIKGKALANMAAAFVPDISQLIPMAKPALIDLVKAQEAEAGGNIVAVASLNEDKTEILLSLYTPGPDGSLQKWKDFDLSNPEKLFQDLQTPDNGNHTATEPAQFIAAPGDAHTASADDE